jgi:broad specificity phosphatase PhoE
MNQLRLMELVLVMIALNFVGALRANDTEFLAFEALKAHSSLPHLEKILITQVKNSVKVKAVPGLFAQQNGVEPKKGELQLENFGALKPWKSIRKILRSSSNYRLLIMIRHGEAWENLNPTFNSNCQFNFEGQVIDNFDSPLSPLGLQQAKNLNNLLKAPSLEGSTESWFETLGLNEESTSFITSPLTRTLQTSQLVFSYLPIPTNNHHNGRIVAHELLRAGIGQAVCNFRLNVHTPTEANILPSPWQTGCNSTSNSSLSEIYSDDSSPVKFNFSIRPAGGAGFGLISDSDVVWRSDLTEDEVIMTRALAFLAQIYENTAESSVTVAITHGEMIGAIYKSAGEANYNATNTEVVPLLLSYN